MKKNNFRITNSQIKNLENILKNAASGDIYDKANVDWIVLKQAAETFKSSYNTLVKLEETDKLKNINKLIQGDPESPGYLKNYALNSNKKAQYERAKYLLAFQFDSAVNKFLNGLPKEALYIYENSKTGEISTFSMNMSELAKRADKHGRLRLSLSNLKSGDRKSLETESEIPLEHVAQARAAYLGTIYRLSQYFEQRGENSRKTQRSNGILMWKLGKQWVFARVLNKGDVKEAYAAALLSKHKTINDKLYNIEQGEPKSYSHELISAFYHNYIYNVTNAPAIQEEDIVGDYKQYGVKSHAASLPGLKQYLDTADWILQTSGAFTKDDLKNFFNEHFSKAAHRNNVIAITENLYDTMSKDIGLTEIEKNTVIKISQII